MTKYDPLLKLLEAATGEVELTFEAIEETLGFALPASARRYPAWWSNSGGTHVQASAWMDAGYRTAGVNVGAGRVRFVPDLGWGLGEMKQAKFETEAPKTQDKGSGGHHPAYGALKGLITIPTDVDLTQPAFEDWKSLYGEAE